MSNSRVGRDLLIAKARTALGVATKREAEHFVNTVISCIEETLIENLENNDFSMKLNSFGKFTIRHKSGIYRKIPFTGETKFTNAKRKVKFVTLGKLRQLEVVK